MESNGVREETGTREAGDMKGKGKKYSLQAKLVCAGGMLVSAVLDNAFSLDIGPSYILQIWLAIAALFLPIDLSLIAKNVFGRK